jgi:uncharacterized protein YdbL (DUF1318 family)
MMMSEKQRQARYAYLDKKRREGVVSEQEEYYLAILKENAKKVKKKIIKIIPKMVCETGHSVKISIVR